MISKVDSTSIDFHSAFFEQIMVLDQQMDDQSWTKQAWISQMNSGKDFLLLISADNKQIFAFALFEVLASMNYAHLLKIATSQIQRNKGHGLNLLKNAIQLFKKHKDIERVILEVKTGNLAAINLYNKINFQTIHTNKKFYSDGSDAYIMQAVL